MTGSVKGDEVEWSFETEDAGKVVYKGKLEGASKIKGTAEYGQLGKGTLCRKGQVKFFGFSVLVSEIIERKRFSGIPNRKPKN